MKSERAENYIFLGSIVLALALVVLIFLPELDALVLGITFAVLFQPLYEWFARHLPRGNSTAALIVVLITTIIIFAPLSFIGYQLFGEATALYAKIAASPAGSVPLLQTAMTKLGITDPSLVAALRGYLEQFFGVIAGNVGSLFSGIASALFAILLSLFALYYFLRDGEKLRQAVIERSPLPDDATKRLIARLHLVMSVIVRGTLLMSALYGLAGGLGFFIFGLPSGVFWGVVTAFAAFIPVFGTYLVIVPGMIALIIEHHYIAAAGLFIWIAVIGLIFENWLRPRLIGKRADIHPLLVLFSVIGGVSLFGPLGILLGPLALGLLLALIDMYPVINRKKEGGATRAAA
jgi:predicted PurR-regulated permease PerM